MARYVLDASAIIALIANELGAEQVEPLLAESCASVVNLGEVAQWLMREGGTTGQADAVIAALEIEAINVDWPQAILAAELRKNARTLGLSQADCLCLALAKARNATVVTSDRAWQELTEQAGVQIMQIR